MILEKIKEHHDKKLFSKIYRDLGEGEPVYTNGYILAYNAQLVLIQETDDFDLSGYVVLFVDDIRRIRYNKYDKYYDKIMMLEGKLEQVGIGYKVDITNLSTLFESIKDQKLNVTVECEDPEAGSFTIGPIEEIGPDSVSIRNFDPTGYYDNYLSTITYEHITKINFDDRYANVFGKYVRYRKITT